MLLKKYIKDLIIALLNSHYIYKDFKFLKEMLSILTIFLQLLCN